MKRYVIKCKSCKKSDVVNIDKDNRILWQDNKHIISGRYRLDNSWGWQCKCGSNNLLTKQEDKVITNKQSPDPKQIEQIVNNVVQDKLNKFEMEVV